MATAYMSATSGQPRPRAIANWLMIVAATVFLMVVVGGITRLTESGLSMVRWEPISGIVPPLNAQQWQAELDAYRATPEYQQINRGMSLEAFKQIYFWEYIHRVIGRMIGLMFAVPLIWFWWKRAVPAGYGGRLTALLALGGLQGAIGWWMVASGLVDRTDVSHVRLAVHLLNALFIFGGLIWTALDLYALARDRRARPSRLTLFAFAVFAILFVQLLLGAFTAGLDAGYAFAEWPTMGGTIFPAGGWQEQWSALRNMIDNPVVVQFVHRWWAWIAAGAALLLARRARTRMPAAPLFVGGLVVVQILLGIGTLLTGVAIPIAVAHQAVGALLVAALVGCAHAVGRPRRG